MSRWDHLDWLTLASAAAISVGILVPLLGGPATFDWLIPLGLVAIAIIGHKVLADATEEDA